MTLGKDLLPLDWTLLDADCLPLNRCSLTKRTEINLVAAYRKTLYAQAELDCLIKNGESFPALTDISRFMNQHDSSGFYQDITRAMFHHAATQIIKSENQLEHSCLEYATNVQLLAERINHFGGFYANRARKALCALARAIGDTSANLPWSTESEICPTTDYIIGGGKLPLLLLEPPLELLIKTTQIPLSIFTDEAASGQQPPDQEASQPEGGKPSGSTCMGLSCHPGEGEDTNDQGVVQQAQDTPQPESTKLLFSLWESP